MSPILTYVVSTIVVLLGVRLCLQALRERQLPEGLLGLFLCLGLGGAGVAVYGIECHRTGDPNGWSIVTVAMAAANLGFASYFGFIWRTFRPDSKLAAVAVGLLTLSAFAG